MDADAARRAAELLWQHWCEETKLETLPPECRPASLAEGYTVQALIPAVAGDPMTGWKLAATAEAGQRHIGVDGPIAGRLLRSRVLAPGAKVPMAGNRMRVGEVEVAFVLRRDLPPRETPYRPDELLDAIESLHPGIELPDSRFADFAKAGGAQLAADCACAHYYVLGPAADERWRETDLRTHPARLFVNGEVVAEGTGADVLGGPLEALAWLAACEAVTATGLRAGELVTTGVIGGPRPIREGDELVGDLGVLGRVSARVGG